MRRAVRPAEVEARLKADKAGDTIKAVLVAQIDTASGVVNDIAAIGQAMRAAGHDALLMVDAVASLGCMPFEMDAWGVDVAMSGSQKGMMTPPGLGFVAANDRAREVHKKAGPAHPLLGLDLPRGRAALPEIRRHAARAPAVRPAPGARHAVRGRPRQRLPAPPAAGRGGASRRRHLGGRPGDRLQHHRAGRALQHGHRRADERATIRRRSAPSATRNAASSSATASASFRARRSASPIWAMSTRR